MNNLLATIESAAGNGKLLAESARNIKLLLDANAPATTQESIAELVGDEAWEELDNRFFRTLAFGTGGLRGKSIGDRVTSPERGVSRPDGRPEFPCVGTNAMNLFNVSRATRGLMEYVLEWFQATGRHGRPIICIAHDTRHFSRDFAEFAAEIVCEMGGDVRLFDGPRSTPELSFAVRSTDAAAGINITASHNPPEYSGFKVYFADGGQIVEPHASRIIERVRNIGATRFTPLPPSEQGSIVPIGQEINTAYLDRLETLVLDRRLLETHAPKVVYSALHGVGGATIPPVLSRLSVPVSVVAEQAEPDGRFPTVKSPNPENPEALELALAQADREGADLVLASDPDDDRLGVAARGSAGKLAPLTGNQIGSILAWYRIRKFFETGILSGTTRDRAVLIKTFVTTDLQKSIAEKAGIRCVETLTGFKYIGAKLEKYERAIPEDLRTSYRRMSEDETRSLRLAHSSLFVFGGEESYGYSGADFVRDKDGNAAAVMVVETAAYAASIGLTLHGLLDQIFMEHGIFLERSESLVFEGAEGAAQIRTLLDSYRNRPPTQIDSKPVTSMKDFTSNGLADSEGDPIPAEAMLLFELDGGFRVAVRPSGTEPKIKFYLFARSNPPALSAELPVARSETTRALNSLWEFLREDARRRAAVATNPTPDTDQPRIS